MADVKNKNESDTEPQETTQPLPQVTDAQKDLAAQALQEFEKKQYGSCCNIIHKLTAQRASDPKVVHNKAVAEFYQSGFLTTDEFRQSLAKVCQMANVNIDNSESLEDVDHSVIYYNQAVILYHLRQYKAALNILDKLFQYIEPLEEALARKAIMLLVELYLCTYQPEKAMGMVNYAEKTVFTTGKSGGEKENKEEQVDETWKPRISAYKTRCLVMMKSMKSCKREIKSLMNTQATNTSVIYLKSNFEYLRGNHRKAMKMLGSMTTSHVFTDAGECLPVMYSNNLGCIHFHLRKHNLGAFHFRKAIQENENALRDIKRGAEQHKNLSGKPLNSIGMSRHFELLYNMGIQLLHCGKPMAAFDCLIEAVQVFRTNPRLWLRLAECCIMANRESNDDDRKLEKRLDVIQGSDGSGIHRKLRLGPGVMRNSSSPGTPAIPAATHEFAALCLRNAMLLLPEDPLTVEIIQTEDSDGTKVAPEIVLVPAPPGNPMRAAEVASLRCSILAASAYVALCLNDYTQALSHAESLLKQPRLSGAQRYLGHLYMAEAQVAMDKIADAIQHLNPELVTDISPHLPESKSEQDKSEKVDKLEKSEAESTENKGSFYPWSPKDLTRAKAIAQYNLATAHAIRGEYDKAVQNLGESSNFIGTPLPAQMYFLKLYLDLIEGRRKMAQIVIKDHFGHVTPNRVEIKINSKPGVSRVDNGMS